MKRNFPTFCLAALAAVVTREDSHAANAVIPVLADTGIIASAPAANMGGHTHVPSGTSNGASTRRGLFQFDLTAIPAGSTINSASFDVRVVGTPGGGGTPSTFDLNVLTAPWIEGTNPGNNGGVPIIGSATWTHSDSSSTMWTTAGGDFVAAASASTPVAGVGPYSWSSPQLVADVQSWVDSPATNFGWIMISQSEGTGQTARRFGSREGGAAATLTVDYTPIPEPGSATLLLAGLGLAACTRRRRS